jgi:predicted RNA-binding Zn ribbon-like protein
MLAWAHRAGIVDQAETAAVEEAWGSTPGGGMPAWRAVLDIREALYGALIAQLERDAVPDGAAAAMERLALHWSGATSRSALVPPVDRGAAAHLVVGTVPALMVPDRLAFLAVELLRTVDLAQVRVCPPAEGGCGWLFPRSQPQRLTSVVLDGGLRRTSQSPPVERPPPVSTCNQQKSSC